MINLFIVPLTLLLAIIWALIQKKYDNDNYRD